MPDLTTKLALGALIAVTGYVARLLLHEWMDWRRSRARKSRQHRPQQSKPGQLASSGGPDLHGYVHIAMAFCVLTEERQTGFTANFRAGLLRVCTWIECPCCLDRVLRSE